PLSRRQTRTPNRARSLGNHPRTSHPPSRGFRTPRSNLPRSREQFARKERSGHPSNEGRVGPVRIPRSRERTRPKKQLETRTVSGVRDRSAQATGSLVDYQKKPRGLPFANAEA